MWNDKAIVIAETRNGDVIQFIFRLISINFCLMFSHFELNCTLRHFVLFHFFFYIIQSIKMFPSRRLLQGHFGANFDIFFVHFLRFNSIGVSHRNSFQQKPWSHPMTIVHFLTHQRLRRWRRHSTSIEKLKDKVKSVWMHRDAFNFILHSPCARDDDEDEVSLSHTFQGQISNWMQ